MKLEKEEVKDIEISILKKEQVEHKLLARYKPKIDGYSIFEYDINEKIIQLASFKQSDIYVLGGVNNSKLETKKDCIYIEALNIKNAIKKLKKGNIIFRT